MLCGQSARYGHGRRWFGRCGMDVRILCQYPLSHNMSHLPQEEQDTLVCLHTHTHTHTIMMMAPNYVARLINDGNSSSTKLPKATDKNPAKLCIKKLHDFFSFASF